MKTRDLIKQEAKMFVDYHKKVYPTISKSNWKEIEETLVKNISDSFSLMSSFHEGDPIIEAIIDSMIESPQTTELIIGYLGKGE